VPRQPPIAHRWLTALTWPVGITLTAFDYMWRVTALHRVETVGHDEANHEPPLLPDDVDPSEIISPEDGSGPLYHRMYATNIRMSDLSPDMLFARLTSDLSKAVPLKLARFHKVLGDRHSVELGDEYVVRMPGPWDGPVRVVDRRSTSFRLATLAGHLEAGQIEFRVQLAHDDLLRFEIESWTRSGDPFSHLLYTRLRIAKEVQAHMWISFLENVVKLSGGEMTGGVDVLTHQVDVEPDSPGRPGQL
jgi:hypothetical protein